MANILPSRSSDRILFFETHEAGWSQRAAAIGTTPEAVATLAARTAAARAALAAQYQAQQAAQAATLAYREAVRLMNETGGDILQQVKAKAATDGEEIYPLAQIPAPARPSPIGPPGMPTNFQVTLNPTGTLQLKWKCPNPAGSSGTIYQIARRVGAAGAFASIGTTGKRRFTDATLPAGAASVEYEITAVRSTRAGTAARFSVNFGVAGGAAVVSYQTRVAA